MSQLQFEHYLLNVLSICTFVDLVDGQERPDFYTLQGHN